jgi:release factor glutamine methyltransferase
MTIREILAGGKSHLAASHIESPDLDAVLLLSQTLHCTRADLVIHGDDTVTPENYNYFNNLLLRRISGESVAYILGRKEFMGLDFTVNPDVLVPRPDTELLVETVLKKYSVRGKGQKNFTVLDLCTGSGAIAISLKHEHPEWEVWASDISKKALTIAKINAENLLGGPKKINFIHADLFSFNAQAPSPPSFSLIVANPPYVSSAEIETLAPEVKKEPHIALDGGPQGLDIIRRICAEASRYLEGSGGLFIEADPRQIKKIAKYLLSGGFENLEIFPDLSGKERVIGGKTRKAP